MSMTKTEMLQRRYTVRVESYGALVLERQAEDLAHAVSMRRQYAEQYPQHQVEVYRPDNIDLGCPTGLTRDEQEQVEEMTDGES